MFHNSNLSHRRWRRTKAAKPSLAMGHLLPEDYCAPTVQFRETKSLMKPRSRNLDGPFFVDAHVHFHPCYPADQILDAAMTNITGCAANRGAPEQILGCLLLAETARDDFFSALRDGSSGVEVGHWRLESTDEEISLLACLNDRPALLLVSGRQIATYEGLEVLALVSGERIRDGLPLDETIEAVRSIGGIALVPWGFGKWWFGRGRLLEQYLRSPKGGSVLLGDNGGRPGQLPRPPLFALVAKQSLPILPGSDPLPMRSQMSRIGTYGFVLEGTLDRRTPAAGLKRLIENLDHQPPVFGHTAGLVRFVVDQCRLRLR